MNAGVGGSGRSRSNVVSESFLAHAYRRGGGGPYPEYLAHSHAFKIRSGLTLKAQIALGWGAKINQCGAAKVFDDKLSHIS